MRLNNIYILFTLYYTNLQFTSVTLHHPPIPPSSPSLPPLHHRSLITPTHLSRHLLVSRPRSDYGRGLLFTLVKVIVRSAVTGGNEMSVYNGQRWYYETA